MNKWTVSGQVADIILDSIKRKIIKVYRGSACLFMLQPGARAHNGRSRSGTGKERRRAAWRLTCLARGCRQTLCTDHAFRASPSPGEVCTVTLRSQGVSLLLLHTS